MDFLRFLRQFKSICDFTKTSIKLWQAKQIVLCKNRCFAIAYFFNRIQKKDYEV